MTIPYLRNGVSGIFLACTALSAHAVTCTLNPQNINFGNYTGAVINVSATITGELHLKGYVLPWHQRGNRGAVRPPTLG